MKPAGKHLFLFPLIYIAISSCVEPYEPAETLNAPDILVIDGYISTADQSATVKITHAVSLSENSSPAPEPGASIQIEEFEGIAYPLTESDAGIYIATGLTLDINKKYRLNVRTSGGKSYLSEYIELIETPPIDSITWRPTSDAVEILVNTHDDTGKAKYYQWKYEETWKYSSNYQSNFVFDQITGEVTWRELSDQNYICFGSSSSTEILLGSTTQQTTDLIRNHVVARIPAMTYKFTRGYSILVKQSVLSEEAYNYWLLLEKTTENLGGLFDPLPAQVTGNITCTSDTSEPVLGYFSGGAETVSRLFIKPSELPNELRYYSGGDPNCMVDSVLFDDMPTEGAYYIVNNYGVPFPVGYLLSSYYCTDCRAQGGQLEVPDFWEE